MLGHLNLTYMEKILEDLNRIKELSTPLQEHLTLMLKSFKFKKKEIIQRQGQVANYIFFIEKGLIRSYFNKRNKEISSWFMKENDFVISVQSFFLQEPAYENLQAIEECLLWGISYQQLQQTYKMFPEFNLHRSIILEKYYSISEQRNHLTLMQKAFDKYVDLLEQQSGLINRVPNKYLASYLGIGAGTLSRIRAQYLNTKSLRKLPYNF